MKVTLDSSQTTCCSSGRACTSCRSIKKRCDGALPRCRRCESRDLVCKPSAIVSRRRLIDVLEEKMNKLESKFATLSSTYERQSLSKSLFNKVRSLCLSSPCCTNGIGQRAPLALFFHATLPFMTPPEGENETDVGYRPVISRSLVYSLLGTWHPHDGPMPTHLSLCFARLFLPFRFQFHFYMNLPHFFDALSRPSNDPNSLHPSLLNAIYLGACHVIGFDYSSFEPFFLDRTRASLNLSLECANRLTHFMWASVILGSYFEMTGRLTESYAVVSPCASFALAGGLDCVNGPSRAVQFPILPPAEDAAEEEDRTRLIQAIYLADRSLALISGFPSTFAGAAPVVADGGGNIPGTTTSEAPRDELADLVHGNLPLNIKIMTLYQRLDELVRETRDTGFDHRNRARYLALQSASSSLGTFLPRLSEPWGIEPFESINPINPYLLVIHATYFGSLLLLHTLTADENVTSRTALFEAARSLVDLCSRLSGTHGFRRMQGSLILIPHMMNAARVFASHLQRPEVMSNSQTLVICYESLAVLADFTYKMTELYPAWDHLMSTFQALLPEPTDALSANMSLIA